MGENDFEALQELLKDEGKKQTSEEEGKILKAPQSILELLNTGAEAWQILLGKGVHFNIEDIYTVHIDMLQLEKQPYILAEVKISKPDGKIYTLFSKEAVKIIVGMMLQLSEEDIKKSLTADILDDDLDAWKEATNQMFGSIGQFLREKFKLKVEVDQANIRQINYPEEKAQIDIKEYKVIEVDVELEGFPNKKAYFIIEQNLYNTLVPEKAPESPFKEEQKPKRPSYTPEELKRILSIEVPVRVLIAEKKLTVKAIMEIAPGSIIEFNKNCEEPLDILVNDKKIGVGEVILKKEKFGIQIKEIMSVKDKIKALGGNSS